MALTNKKLVDANEKQNLELRTSKTAKIIDRAKGRNTECCK